MTDMEQIRAAAQRDALRTATAFKIQSRADAVIAVLAFAVAALAWCLATGEEAIDVLSLIVLTGGFLLYMLVRIALLRRRLTRDLSHIPAPFQSPQPKEK